jgi:peptide/nickel transport system ATP-binding protein
MSVPFLDVSHLTAVSTRDRCPVLRDVSISVAPGEIHGLVGESGAGKSTLGKAILGMLPDTIRPTGGTIRLGGVDLAGLSQRQRRALVAQSVALVPQDPLSALNPAYRIEPQVTDALRRNKGLTRTAARDRVLDLFAQVHLRDPERVLASYPHELSGGMRQRVLIAAAFAAEPKLVVADEPTSALDVTVQREVLRILRDMQRRQGTAVVFVTHDLGVVAQVCDRVTLLFAGKVVETGPTSRMLDHPGHAYTQALVAASPRPETGGGLQPIPAGILQMCRAEIAAFDREVRT